MDPTLQDIGVQLGEIAVRNTSTLILQKVKAIKAGRKTDETVTALEELINELLADKIELVGIAQAYEQELVAQRLSAENIDYLTQHLLPTLKELFASSAEAQGNDRAKFEAQIDSLAPLLSVQAATILQLVGFNFKRAIGEPLTDLIAGLISARSKTDSQLVQETQLVRLRQEVALLDIMRDADAYQRLLEWRRGGT